MNEIFVCIIEEVIEEMQQQIQNKYDCTFCNICIAFTENLTVTEKISQFIIGQPYHENTDNCCGDTH